MQGPALTQFALAHQSHSPQQSAWCKEAGESRAPAASPEFWMMPEWQQAELLCFQLAAGQWQGLREGDALQESRAAAGGRELVADPTSCVQPTTHGTTPASAFSVRGLFPPAVQQQCSALPKALRLAFLPGSKLG